MDNENIYGRKIFFLNSSYEFKKYVLPALHQAEYEAYIIDNYKDAKNVLRHNPDSFLYVMMNGDLSIKGWFNFVKSIEKEPEISKTVIGIIGDTRVKEDDKKMFLTGANIQGGFFTIGIDKIEKIIDDIKGVLELNQAKGRRQYVRATCIQDREAKMFWTYAGKMHMFQLLDISSVGMAAIAPVSAIPHLQKDIVLTNVSLLLAGRQYPLSLKLYNVTQRHNIVVAVFMITAAGDPATNDAIRKYINDTLFAKIQKELFSCSRDNTNYNAESGIMDKDEKSDKSADNKDKEAETGSASAENDATEEKPEETQATGDSSAGEAASGTE